jgi:thioredoxin 1
MSKFQELISSSKPVLIDFHAEWCGPCKMMSPIVKQVATEIGDKATIVKIDVDKNQQIASHYQIKGVPTLMIFKNGKSVWRQSGVVQKNQLLQILSSFV